MKGIMLNERVGLETATLNGSKERTSRLEFKTSAKFIGMSFFTKGKSKLLYARFDFNDGCHYDSRLAIGDVVAIKQAYNIALSQLDWVNRMIYKDEAGWTNKMFVRADLMPHQIEITDIKLERLQDISDEDCLKEGVKVSSQDFYFCPGNGRRGINKCFKTPKEAFASLIDKISGKGTWMLNEYHVVYYYKLVKYVLEKQETFR